MRKSKLALSIPAYSTVSRVKCLPDIFCLSRYSAQPTHRTSLLTTTWTNIHTTWNPSTLEGRQEEQEFKTSIGYTRYSDLEKKEEKKKKKRGEKENGSIFLRHMSFPIFLKLNSFWRIMFKLAVKCKCITDIQLSEFCWMYTLRQPSLQSDHHPPLFGGTGKCWACYVSLVLPFQECLRAIVTWLFHHQNAFKIHQLVALSASSLCDLSTVYMNCLSSFPLKNSRFLYFC